MTLSALTSADLEFFAQNGYLVVGNSFHQETEIKPVVAADRAAFAAPGDRWDGTQPVCA